MISVGAAAAANRIGGASSPLLPSPALQAEPPEYGRVTT